MALLLAGCMIAYVPSVIAVDEAKMGPIAMREPVRLVNAQAASDPLVFGNQAGTDFTADLHAWIETAVVEMRRALAQRGMLEKGKVDRSASHARLMRRARPAGPGTGPSVLIACLDRPRSPPFPSIEPFPAHAPAAGGSLPEKIDIRRHT